MKKLLLGLMSLLMIVGSINAQTGKKAFKEATKKLKDYHKDPVANVANLQEAMELMNVAFESDEVTSEAKYYVQLGEVYNDIANTEIKHKLLNPDYDLATPDAGIKALEAFKKVLMMGDKEKDAYKGLEALEGNLNNIAITYYQKQDYAGAHTNYAATLEVHDLLKAGGKDSALDEEGKLAEQKYYTAATGYYGNKLTEIVPLLEEMYAAGTSEALVYEALYKANKETDSERALTYLSKGREMLPDDTQLLFAEINHYLTAGQLDVLITKLEVAKEKEPDNMSVVNTMGNVYDQLNQKERTTGNIEKADEYLDKAKMAFDEVLAKEPNNFDATYSLGALYYNKAASLTDKINELANDFTPAGTKKYNTLKEEMDSYFQEAKPYFESAETINPEDVNTLIALKEIAARSNDFEKADAYKKRIEALTGN